jgi:hypothetical protein
MMFLGFFGTFWTVFGCVDYYGFSLPILSISVITGLSIVMIGWSLSADRAATDGASPNPADLQRQRTFRLVNTAQWVGIPVLIVALNIVDHPEWIRPGILLIVGVHFLPLAKLFSSRLNLITGVMLIAVAALSPLYADGGPASPAVPLWAGVILWLSALVTFTGVVRRARGLRCAPWTT